MLVQENPCRVPHLEPMGLRHGRPQSGNEFLHRSKYVHSKQNNI